MKLKNLVGCAIAAASVMLLSANVLAATQMKIGTVANANTGAEVTSVSAGDYVAVPVNYDSTVYPEIQAYDVNINFDSSKFEYANMLVDNFYTTSSFMGSTTTTYVGKIGSDVTQVDNGLLHVFWSATDGYAHDIADFNSNNSVMLVAFKAKTATTVSSDDFSVTLNVLARFENGVARIDDFASYLSFEVPADLTEYGYIHEVYIDLNDGEKTEKLDKCIEVKDDDGNVTAYKFIVNIKNLSSEKKVVPAKVTLNVADTEDAKTYKSVEYLDLGNVSIEPLNAIK